MPLPRPVASLATSFLRPSRLVAAGQAAVLTLLVAGVASWAVFDRTVTLTVDGQAQEVRILGNGVDDVLSAAGVEVGDRDLVSPGTDESVADGSTVVVRHARELTLANPAGDETTYWTTALTVDEALSDIGVRAEGAWLSASRSSPIGRSGLDVTMSMPKTVTVVADGETREVVSAVPTVGELMTEVGLEAGEQDRLSAAPADLVTEGQQLVLQRVTTSEVTDTVTVPAPAASTVEDDSILEGETRVVEAGNDGAEAVVSRVLSVDGVEESREELSRTVTTAPVGRVVAEGTKPRPAPVAAPVPAPRASTPATRSATPAPAAAPPPVPASSSGADGLNWSALAACESGGRVDAVSGTGKYHGLYQFSTATWGSVGGSGLPSQASAGEQTERAKALYTRSGAGQWPHCGPRLFR